MTQLQVLLLETHLKKLRLPSILKQYRKLAPAKLEFLQVIVEQEVQSQEENAYRQRLKSDRFPAQKE